MSILGSEKTGGQKPILLARNTHGGTEMGERNPEATVPTADHDVTAGDGPKPPWTKPRIRIMKISFTRSADGDVTNLETGDDVPYIPPSS